MKEAENIEDWVVHRGADAESLSAAGYKKSAKQMEKKWQESELREELK